MNKTKMIPLLKRDNKTVVAETIVDEDMYEFLSEWTWRCAKGYAHRGYRDRTEANESNPYGPYVNVWMHRVVLGVQEDGLPVGYEVDHINRNPLDNRRCNLRVVTHEENMNNLPTYTGSSSRFKGVYWDDTKGTWIAQVRFNGEQIYLGQHTDEIDAHKACEKFRADNGLPLESELANA